VGSRKLGEPSRVALILLANARQPEPSGPPPGSESSAHRGAPPAVGRFGSARRAPRPDLRSRHLHTPTSTAPTSVPRARHAEFRAPHAGPKTRRAEFGAGVPGPPSSARRVSGPTCRAQNTARRGRSRCPWSDSSARRGPSRCAQASGSGSAAGGGVLGWSGMPSISSVAAAVSSV
jgi:hypothetical protein